MRPTLLAATLLVVPAFCGAARAQPVSGLYIGVGGGGNFLQDERITSITAGGVTAASKARARLDTGVVGIGSLGYGFGNGVRVELEGDYRYNRISSIRTATPAIRSVGGREQKYGPMANVLFDLDVGSPYVFPYIGTGAGVSWVARRVREANANGTLVNEGGTSNSFAYQAIAGVSFPIPPVVGLSLTAEYRYFALAGEREFGRAVSGPGGAVSSQVRTADNYNHSLLLGLRYAFYVPPPPPPAAPAPAEAVQQPTRTYLVFFDWDRADLAGRARQIVAEAASAAARVQVTRIEVSGHADRSGTDRYNMGLSIRRAKAVADELVRDGVARETITTQGFGERQPLVPTAAGVREPHNRRVEIVLR